MKGSLVWWDEAGEGVGGGQPKKEYSPWGLAEMDSETATLRKMSVLPQLPGFLDRMGCKTFAKQGPASLKCKLTQNDKTAGATSTAVLVNLLYTMQTTVRGLCSIPPGSSNQDIQ